MTDEKSELERAATAWYERTLEAEERRGGAAKWDDPLMPEALEADKCFVNGALWLSKQLEEDTYSDPRVGSIWADAYYEGRLSMIKKARELCGVKG